MRSTGECTRVMCAQRPLARIWHAQKHATYIAHVVVTRSARVNLPLGRLRPICTFPSVQFQAEGTYVAHFRSGQRRRTLPWGMLYRHTLWQRVERGRKEASGEGIEDVPSRMEGTKRIGGLVEASSKASQRGELNGACGHKVSTAQSPPMVRWSMALRPRDVEEKGVGYRCEPARAIQAPAEREAHMQAMCHGLSSWKKRPITSTVQRQKSSCSCVGATLLALPMRSGTSEEKERMLKTLSRRCQLPAFIRMNSIWAISHAW